jgi:outer membrane protein assembly factor BamD (BamD/ComL family)
MRAFNALSISLLAIVIFTACSSKQDNLKTEIKTLEDVLFADASKMIDKAKARELIDKYVQFGDDFPESKEAPQMLFQAGDMAMNLNMSKEAIELFDRIMNNYPDFEKTPQCLFLKGYIYENNMGDLTSAKLIYEEFLEKYPDDEFADDAEVSIKNLGKSPEELIKEFEKLQKEQADQVEI